MQCVCVCGVFDWIQENFHLIVALITHDVIGDILCLAFFTLKMNKATTDTLKDIKWNQNSELCSLTMQCNIISI